MDIKLIAVDLDGTLLNERKEIPAGFFELVTRLHQRGVRTVIASGRQYFNLLKLFGPLRDKLLFICDNGGLIFEGEKVLRHRAISPAAVSGPYRAAAAVPEAFTLLCGARAAYMKKPDPVAERNVRLYYESRCICDDPLAAAADDSIVKIAIFHPGDAATVLGSLRGAFGPELVDTLAGKNWLDFMRSGVNKGEALGFLQKHLAVTPEECMAFGDYLNDLEMLRSVRFSYAMSNAHPDVLAAARFTAPSNNDDGVMQVLKSFFP